MKHFDRIWVNGHETRYSFEYGWIWMSVCFLFELTPDEFPNFPLVSQNKKLKIQLYILHRFDRQPWLSLHTLSLSQASCVLLEGNDKSFPAPGLMNYLVKSLQRNDLFNMRRYSSTLQVPLVRRQTSPTFFSCLIFCPM